MENKKKPAISALKKEVKTKTVKEASSTDNKTREEIEEMFNASFGCDCSSCSHHCGE